MNQPEQVIDPALLRKVSTYPSVLQENVRPRDVDMQAHVNNAVYVSYFEMGRAMARRTLTPGPLPEGRFMVVARQVIDYIAPLSYPARIEIGTGILRIGRSSYTYSSAVFCEGRCAAYGEAVMVMTDKESGKSTVMPDDFRKKLEVMLLRGS